jgi:peptidoglycan/LPS O-acetylase OafA/YrhL
LAVTAVVAFHANLFIPGGFLGVDIFFVISGFVITGMLLRELERNHRISLVDFYVRRIRRLTPALVVVLLFTIAMTQLPFWPILTKEQVFQTAIGSLLIS